MRKLAAQWSLGALCSSAEAHSCILLHLYDVTHSFQDHERKDIGGEQILKVCQQGKPNETGENAIAFGEAISGT